MNQRIGAIALAALCWAGCRSASYFETPNHFRNLSATLYLVNGKSYEGRLAVNSENVLGSAVRLYPPGERQAMKFALEEVEGFRLRNEYYALKEIRGGLSLRRNYSFMKRLTPDSSRIHLYEDLQANTESDRNNQTRTRYETQYYLQLPGEGGDAVWALNGSKFVPNFDEKMSRLVGDCPLLAEKIRRKEKDYFYAQVSVFREKRAEVLLHIISEYNRCGTAARPLPGAAVMGN